MWDYWSVCVFIVAIREMNYINTRNFNVTTLLCSYSFGSGRRGAKLSHDKFIWLALGKELVFYFLKDDCVVSVCFQIQRLEIGVLSCSLTASSLFKQALEK